MEEVKVYVDCLDGDNRGDLVRCSDCGELMLIQIGGTACGECESENLQWYDDNYYDNGAYLYELGTLSDENKLYCAFPW